MKEIRIKFYHQYCSVENCYFLHFLPILWPGNNITNARYISEQGFIFIQFVFILRIYFSGHIV